MKKFIKQIFKHYIFSLFLIMGMFGMSQVVMAENYAKVKMTVNSIINPDITSYNDNGLFEKQEMIFENPEIVEKNTEIAINIEADNITLQNYQFIKSKTKSNIPEGEYPNNKWLELNADIQKQIEADIDNTKQGYLTTRKYNYAGNYNKEMGDVSVTRNESFGDPVSEIMYQKAVEGEKYSETAEEKLFFPNRNMNDERYKLAISKAMKVWGYVKIEASGYYSFSAYSDDGAYGYITVNGQKKVFVEDWTVAPAFHRTNNEKIYLEAGKPYPIYMEWFEGHMTNCAFSLYYRKYSSIGDNVWDKNQWKNNSLKVNQDWFYPSKNKVPGDVASAYFETGTTVVNLPSEVGNYYLALKIKNKKDNVEAISKILYGSFEVVEGINLKKISLLEITDSGTSDFSAEDKGKLGSLTTMSMKQFVALRQELEGLYDAVYIGKGTYNSQELGAGSGYDVPRHATKDKMNDITNLKANEIKTNFIEKGYLVILHDDIFKGTKLNSNFSTYKTDIKENVKIVNENIDVLEILEVYTALRPEFEITNFNDGKTFNNGDTINISYNFTGELESVKLYIDSNFNHRIESNEIVASGSNESISYKVPRSLSGIRYFMVEAIDKNGRRTIKNGYFIIKGETVKVNILQVMNKNNTGSLLNTSNMDQSFLISDKNEKDYEINIRVIGIEDFNQTEYKNINGKYGMIIFGFADSYGNSNGSLSTEAKAELDRFIATGQSVMFTHDMIFKNSPSWSSYKGVFGQIEPEHNLGLGAPATTTNTQKVNEGILTMYPFTLGENIEIANTHNQYFTLDLEQGDVIPWYNLTGNDRDEYDSYNHYYTYSKGNLTYSGTGHTPSKFPESEQQLFVNTMFRAFIGSNHAPRITVESPTVDDWILGEDKIQFKFMVEDFDIGDNTSKVQLLINDKSIYSNNSTGHGVWIETKSNNYIKGQINTIKIIAEDKKGAKTEEVIELYIPDDDIQINFLNPKENYLQTNDGIIVVFEIESKYKIPSKDTDGNIIEHKLAELKIPKMTINSDKFNFDTGKTELVLTNLLLDENDARKESIDKGELLVKKYQVKIQHDLSAGSFYKQIIDSTKVKLIVDLETNTKNEKERLTIKKEKEVEITKPIVNKVSIKNLSAKIFFESLLDKDGNKISGMDNIYAEDIVVKDINKVESDIYVKQGDKIEIIFEYEDKYLEGLSTDDIKKLISLDNGFIESSKIEINTSGEKITATYTLKFKNEVIFNDEKVEFSLKISDQNGGRAELDKIILKTSKDIGEFAIDLIEKNVVEEKNYIGNSHDYGFKLTNQVEDISNIGAYLIVFEYDWTKSDLTSEPSEMPKNIQVIDSNNYFYFVSKEKEINLTNKIDGEYKVKVIPLDKAGKNSTGKNTLEEILKSITFVEESLIYYVDTVAPKVESVEIEKTKEGTHESMLNQFFTHGIIDSSAYKAGDSIAVKIIFVEKNLLDYEIKIGDKVQESSISGNDKFTLKSADYELSLNDNEIKISYIIRDKAGNKTELSNNDSLKISFETETAGKVEVDSKIKDKDNKIKFANDNIKLKILGTKPAYIIATSNNNDNTGRKFGNSTVSELKDLKDGAVMFLPTEGKHNISFYSFSKSGQRTDNVEEVLVDKNINYNGRLRSKTPRSSTGSYTIKLNFDDVTEYVGLKSYEIINYNTANITAGAKKDDLTTKNQPSLNPVGGVTGEPTITFVHNVPQDKILKIKFTDKLGNEKVIDYHIVIESQLEIIGKKAGESQEIRSIIDIGGDNIDIKGRDK